MRSCGTRVAPDGDNLSLLQFLRRYHRYHEWNHAPRPHKPVMQLQPVAGAKGISVSCAATPRRCQSVPGGGSIALTGTPAVTAAPTLSPRQPAPLVAQESALSQAAGKAPGLQAAEDALRCERAARRELEAAIARERSQRDAAAKAAALVEKALLRGLQKLRDELDEALLQLRQSTSRVDLLRAALHDAEARAQAAAGRECSARTLASECMLREAQRAVARLEAVDQGTCADLPPGTRDQHAVDAICGSPPREPEPCHDRKEKGEDGICDCMEGACDKGDDQSAMGKFTSGCFAVSPPVVSMTTAERDAVRKIEGRLVTSEVVVFSVAACAPARWAAVCRATARSCAWAMSCWSTCFLAHVHLARKFQSKGLENVCDAYWAPQPGVLWVGRGDMQELLNRTRATPCFNDDDWHAQGVLTRCLGYRINLYDELGLQICDLRGLAWSAIRNADNFVKTVADLLGNAAPEPAPT